MMIDRLLFVFSHSSLDLVHKTINRGVHVFFGMIGVDRTTIYTNGCLGFMPELFYGQDTLNIRNQVKVAGSLLQLGFDVPSKRISNFDVMA